MSDMLKIKRLIDQGRLIPIIGKSGDQVALIGYRRKPNSRKSRQTPVILKQPIPINIANA